MVMGMKLPDKPPLRENVVITSQEELKEAISEVLKNGSGGFLKIFGKTSKGKHYLTVLFDRSKVLAAESLLVDENRSVVGEEAVNALQEMLHNPMVLDAYVLNDIEIKLSIADNLEVYSKTPKIPVGELFGERGWKPEEEKTKPQAVSVEKPSVKRGERVASGEKQPLKKEEKIVIKLSGGTLPEEAFKHYAEELLKEAERVGVNISRIEFEGRISGGVLYLNVTLKGSTSQNVDISTKKMLHAVSKYAPVLLREADIKPILKDVRIQLGEKEIRPREIKESENRKVDNVTPDGRIKLSALEEVWPYLRNCCRLAIDEIESEGIKITRGYFEVLGRREMELRVSLAVISDKPEEEVRKVINDVVSRHFKEIGRTLGKYTLIKDINIELTRPVMETERPMVTSEKAAAILSKKALLEKEVEELLKQAGIDELAPFTEEKKKEAQELVVKSRVQPAVEELKNRLNTELKTMPRVIFRWLKLNHEIVGTSVYVDLEVSLRRENVEGLFGTFSGASEEEIKRDVENMIKRIIREVSKEHGISLVLRKLRVIVR